MPGLAVKVRVEASYTLRRRWPSCCHAGGGQDHQRDAASGGGGVVALVQNVPPGQEPGVVGQAEQIAEGGHDVHSAARLVHLHRLVHGAAPEDQRVAVAGGVPLGVGDAPQLVVIIGVRVGQQVGIVVGGQTDHRVVGDARCLQLLQQIGQRALQLQIGGHIRLHLRGGVGVAACAFWRFLAAMACPQP